MTLSLKKCFPNILAERQRDRQTNTHTQTYSQQYFATTPECEVKIEWNLDVCFLATGYHTEGYNNISIPDRLCYGRCSGCTLRCKAYVEIPAHRHPQTSPNVAQFTASLPGCLSQHLLSLCWDMRTDRQANRHTDTLIAILCTRIRGKVNIGRFPSGLCLPLNRQALFGFHVQLSLPRYIIYNTYVLGTRSPHSLWSYHTVVLP